MIHTRIVVRPYSAAPDPSNVARCPRIPRPFQLRVLPFAPRVAGQAAGSYPVQLVQPDSGGETLIIPDGAVLRFVNPPHNGFALAEAATPSGLPDTWLVQWTDDPADHLEPVPAGVRGVLLWDSGVVAGGAVVASPVLDLCPYSELLAVVQNGDAAARNLGLTPYLDDAVTALSAGPTVAVPAGSAHVAFGQAAAAVGGVLAVSAPLPTKARATMAAGAGGAGRLTLIGR